MTGRVVLTARVTARTARTAPAATRRASRPRADPAISQASSADDELVVRAKHGDHGAWGELYAAHAGRLLVWLRTLPTGDAGVAAEDLAAESWLTAATRIADFHGSSSEFAGWLFGIARFQARNASRKSARRMTIPASTETLELVGAPHATAGVDADADGWVTWLLGHLPERERQVVACIDVVGLDTATTAAALGISTTAVRVARHRGLRRLRAVASLSD